MKKTNNSIAIQFEDLITQCDEVIAETENTLTEFNYSQKEIKNFVKESGLISLRKDYARDHAAASSMSEDAVHDTFTIGYMEEARAALEHMTTRVNETLASTQERQRQ